jgi:hypothetical protein
MKTSSYMTRALKAKDPRYARILGRLGYEAAAPVAEEVDEIPDPVEAAPAKSVEKAAVELHAPAVKPKRAARKAPKALDHDDSGKAGGSRKSTAKAGRYKTRALKAEA